MISSYDRNITIGIQGPAILEGITEKGNIVQFGPKEGDHYIFNPETEEKVMLHRKGRKFVLDVNFLADGGVSLFSGRA